MRTSQPLTITLLIITSAIGFAKECVVTNFGAVLDATLQCSDIVLDNLFVPEGSTLKLNLTDGAKVTFKGNTTFGFANWFGPLVTINGTGITVQGADGSIIDGGGQLYWDGLGGNGTPKPQFFTIQAFGGSVFKNITVLNSPKDVVQVTNSDDVLFTDWIIDNRAGDQGRAPPGKENKNSDGFDVWNSTNVTIRDSIVFNQDDCLALRCGRNIEVYNLFCHGGHGLSISVGFSKDDVSVNTLRNATIRDSILVGGENGIHIKTHNDGGPGSISNVTYRNIHFSGSKNYGIEIQQNYPRGEVVGNVPITDLTFVNVTGNVTDKAIPVFILCAGGACGNWHWSGVSVEGKKANECSFEPEGFKC